MDSPKQRAPSSGKSLGLPLTVRLIEEIVAEIRSEDRLPLKDFFEGSTIYWLTPKFEGRLLDITVIKHSKHNDSTICTSTMARGLARWCFASSTQNSAPLTENLRETLNGPRLTFPHPQRCFSSPSRYGIESASEPKPCVIQRGICSGLSLVSDNDFYTPSLEPLGTLH